LLGQEEQRGKGRYLRITDSEVEIFSDRGASFPTKTISYISDIGAEFTRSAITHIGFLRHKWDAMEVETDVGVFEVKLEINGGISVDFTFR